MDKDFEIYFNFMESMLEDGPISKETKMGWIKDMTMELVRNKLSDYANQNTELFNTYMNNLRKGLQ